MLQSTACEVLKCGLLNLPLPHWHGLRERPETGLGNGAIKTYLFIFIAIQSKRQSKVSTNPKAALRLVADRHSQRMPIAGNGQNRTPHMKERWPIKTLGCLEIIVFKLFILLHCFELFTTNFLRLPKCLVWVIDTNNT